MSNNENLVEISFENEYERNLAFSILKFYDKIDKITENYEIHVLCDWLYDVCVAFTSFYSNCKVVEEGKVNFNRQFLCEVTQMSLLSGFKLLGIAPVRAM